jgi:dipeptidyl aminopeptidase/acylaminoacyl peptidase
MSNKTQRPSTVAAAFLLLIAVGCGPRPTGTAPAAPGEAVALAPPTGAAVPATVAGEPASFPPLPPPKLVEPGIAVHETIFASTQIWVYLPVNAAAPASLPCVFVAPAGAPLVYGNDMDEGYRAEHLPYARAGFAVVGYSIAGGVPDKPTEAQFIGGARLFKDAEGGLMDARRAIAFTLARVPAVNPKRLYTAGHSSAGTLSLLVAENEPQVAACVAYAPCSDVHHRLGDLVIKTLDAKIAGFGAFIDRTSPINGASRLRCPLFLFHSQEDMNVPITESVAFVNEVKKTNPNVTFIQAQHGGHYNSMIQEGIPKAIQWLKALPDG